MPKMPRDESKSAQARKALIYVRQSAGRQLASFRESGQPAAGDRPQYQCMLAAIRGGAVGVVIASDALRITSSKKWREVSRLCERCGVELITRSGR
jgi:DNA invertase Pin-like site-specific DNA recombinase